jgi:hypothetical protein
VRYCAEPRTVSRAKAVMKKCNRGNGTMFTERKRGRERPTLLPNAEPDAVRERQHRPARAYLAPQVRWVAPCSACLVAPAPRQPARHRQPGKRVRESCTCTHTRHTSAPPSSDRRTPTPTQRALPTCTPPPPQRCLALAPSSARGRTRKRRRRCSAAGRERLRGYGGGWVQWRGGCEMGGHCGDVG